MADLNDKELDKIYGGYAAGGKYEGAPDLAGVGRNARILGGWVTKGAGEMLALPTNIYELANMGVNYAQGNELAANTLPGIEDAKAWTERVDAEAKRIGESVAGEALTPGLLDENNAPIQRVGQALSLGFSPLPAAGIVKKAFDGVKAFKTGVAAIDKTKDIIATGSLIASPILPISAKHIPGFLAGNAIIGGGITVASELLTSPNPEAQAKGKEVAAATVAPDAIETFFQEVSKDTTSIENAFKQFTDISTKGVEQATNARKELEIEEAFRQFGSIEPVPGFGLEDATKTAATIGGVILGAGIVLKARGAKTGKIMEVFGGDALGKKALSGAEGGITKPDASMLSAGEVATAQGFDASLPLKKFSQKPEEIADKFERVAVDPTVKLESMMADGKIGGESQIVLNAPLRELVARVDEIKKSPDDYEALRNATIYESEKLNRTNAWIDGQKNPILSTKSVDDPVVVSGYKRWLDDNKANNPNMTPEAIEQKFSFHKTDLSFDDLERGIAQARANPLISSVLDDMKDVSNKLLDYRLEQGNLTKADHARLLREHPNFTAFPIEGSHMSRLELSKMGGRENPGDPIQELIPYIKQTFKEVSHDKLKTAVILEQKALRDAGDANAKKLLGRETAADNINQHTSKQYVQFKDATGKRMAIEVTDPTYRNALNSNAGSGMLRLNEGGMRVLAAPSRALEWATTGPASALFGSPFALANMMYGMFASLVNRPKGTSAGLLDKAVQNTIGSGILKIGNWDGKFGMRADPTFIAQTVWQAGESVVAVMAKHASRALENAVTNHNIHAPAAGPSSLQALSTVMSNAYKKTILHDLEARGLRGGAMPMWQAKSQTMADLESSMSTSARASKGWAATRDFIHDIFGAVGNAPQGAYFKQNKGRMSDELLTTRTRNLMGNPGRAGLATSGFGKTVNQAILVTPWGGVTAQATSRFLKAWKENPVGTATAVFGSVAVPGMMAMKWNMMLGPEYIDHMLNKQTPDQVSGSIYIGVAGRPANEGVNIRLDQPIRPLWVLTQMLFGHTFGMYDGSIYDPKNAAAKTALEAGIAERYSAWGSAMRSAVGQVIPAMNPLVNIYNIGTGGGTVGRSYIEPPTKIVENRNRGATDSTSSHIDNKLFGYNVSAEMEAMVQAAGGQVARAFYETLVGYSQGKKDGLDNDRLRSDFQDRYKQRISQANREIAWLWGHATVMSPSQESTAAAIRPKVLGIKKLEAAGEVLNRMNGAGAELSGGRKREIVALIGEGPVKFKDQQMYALAKNAQAFMTQYNTQVSGPLSSLYQQRASVQSSTKYTPETKTIVLNKISEKIVDQNRKGMSMIKQWEWGMSKKFNADINIDEIKLDQGIDQFRKP